MQVHDTREDFEVESILQWSIAQRVAGRVQEQPNWDKASPRRNSCFQDIATGRQWVVYHPDQDLPGEVRVLPVSSPGA